MDPTQRFHITQIGMLWTLVRKLHMLVAAQLRHQNDASDLFDLGVVRGTHSIHEPRNLSSQVWNANESLQNVLREHISVAQLFKVVRVDIDVICSQVHVCRRDCSHPPVSLRCELFFFVLRQGSDYHLCSVNIGWPECFSLQLTDGCVLLCNPFHFLLLNWGWCHIHPQYDVLDFTGSQRCHIAVVLLGVVGENQIFELNLDVDPLFVSERRPDVVRLRNHALVWSQNYFGALRMQMQWSEN